MKRNQNPDHNHSQKVLSCRYNMDTNRVEARFEDGTTLSIDCIAIEDEYGNTPAQRAELDWLLYNKPLEYARLVLGAEIEHLVIASDAGDPYCLDLRRNDTAVFWAEHGAGTWDFQPAFDCLEDFLESVLNVPKTQEYETA